MSIELTKKIEEAIYFALTHWGMNPMTKGFVKELTKEIDRVINQHTRIKIN